MFIARRQMALATAVAWIAIFIFVKPARGDTIGPTNVPTAACPPAWTWTCSTMTFCFPPRRTGERFHLDGEGATAVQTHTALEAQQDE